jgi:hypothetical protein
MLPLLNIDIRLSISNCLRLSAHQKELMPSPLYNQNNCGFFVKIFTIHYQSPIACLILSTTEVFSQKMDHLFLYMNLLERAILLEPDLCPLV